MLTTYDVNKYREIEKTFVKNYMVVCCVAGPDRYFDTLDEALDHQHYLGGIIKVWHEGCEIYTQCLVK